MDKKAKETGELAAEICKKIKCHNCGKAGHISTDCKKEKSGKPQKGKSTKNKGEKVGSIFSDLEVSYAVDSEDDEDFVASQGVVFCATCELDDEEDYPVDAEGEELEVMEESEHMPELIAPVASEPEPAQPSRYSAFYPLPPVGAPESTWRDYAVINRFLIQRHFRNWLAHQLQHYVQNQLPSGSIMYDPTLSESENQARWQSDNVRRITQHDAVLSTRRLSDRYRRHVTPISRILSGRVGAQRFLR